MLFTKLNYSWVVWISIWAPNSLIRTVISQKKKLFLSWLMTLLWVFLGRTHRALEFLPKVSSKWREARVNIEQNALQTILTGSPCDILWSCSITSSNFLSRFIILFTKEKWRRSQYQIIRSLLPKLKSGSNCSKHEWLHNRVWFQCENQD